MDKCPICGKEANSRNYGKIGKEIILFCSGKCAEEFMLKKCREENVIMAIRVEEYND